MIETSNTERSVRQQQIWEQQNIACHCCRRTNGCRQNLDPPFWAPLLDPPSGPPRFKRRILHAPNRIVKLSICDIFQFDASHSNIQLIQSNMRLNFDSWFKRRILHVPNWVEIMLNNLCLLEWEFKTRHSRSAILYGKTMRQLKQISRMYSFESTKISIWFGACKMRRLNQAFKGLITFIVRAHSQRVHYLPPPL